MGAAEGFVEAVDRPSSGGAYAIREELGIEKLEELEMAAHDGRRERV